MTRSLAIFAFLSGFFPPLSIAGANIALAGFLALSLFACATGREPFRFGRTSLDGPVLALLAAWLVSSLFGLDPAKSLGKLPSQVRFVFFYALLSVGEGRHKGAAFKGFLWGAGAAVAYGLLQSVGHWVGLTEGTLAYLALDTGRVHGAVHPLTYAEVVLPFFLLGTAFFLEAGGRREFWIGAVWMSLSGLTLVLSQSRGPWLGVALGGLILAVLHPRRGRLLIIVAGLAVAASYFPPPFDVFRRARREGRSHRFILWNNAWQVARRHPALGVGTGNLKLAVEHHRHEPGFLPNPAGKDGDAHNQYLQHLAERGPAGLAALLAILAIPLVAAARLLHRSEPGDPPRWVAWGLLAFFIAFPAVNITERAFDDAEPALVFWMLAALPAIDRRCFRRRTSS